MYARMYICIFVCMYVCVFVQMYSMCVCTNVQHVCMCINSIACPSPMNHQRCPSPPPDTPLGYATLGTRRPASSKLATIQRSRSPTASLRCTTPTPAQTPPCFSLNPDGGGGTVLKLSVERIVPEGEPSAQAKRRQSEPAVPEAVAEPRERTAAEDPPEGGPGRRSTDGGDQTEGGGHPTAQHIQDNSSFGHLPRAPEEILLDAIVGSIKAKKTGGLARDKPPTPPPRAPPAEPPQTAGEIQVLEEAGGITVTVESAPDEAN